MLRRYAAAVTKTRRPFICERGWPISNRLAQPCFSSHAATGQASEEDLTAARDWLSRFDPETVPRSICDVSFSRSSGPGGQNVNKVNSKATLRVPLQELLRLLPPLLHAEVQASRYCRAGSGNVVIQAEESRKQADNTQSCFVKLHAMILEAAARVVPGETSESQKQRVKGLQKAANESRLRGKRLQSNKKSARKGNGGSDGY